MKPVQNEIICPLCESAETGLFLGGEDREFWKCSRCALIFVHQDYHLDSVEEKARYEQHQNRPEDPNYRRFLSRLVDPLMTKLKVSDRGLDFGAGPGPTLSVMMGEQGYVVKDYDPIFCPQKDLHQHRYSFITCSETAEHFYCPRKEFLFMDDLLQAGGWLGLMTEWVTQEERFPQWYYRRDPTHVSFYRRQTLEWIAGWRSWEVEFPDKNIALFNKKTEHGP